MSKNKNIAAGSNEKDATDFRTIWHSPSNIALIKYWGKTGNQVPMNASLSMTLHHSYTNTEVRAVKKEFGSEEIQLSFRFQGEDKPAFQYKIIAYLQKIIKEMPFLKDYALEINSSNTFPHSAGIASSASSMSALALCLLSLNNKIMRKKMNHRTFQRKASNLARMGSGSACRSVYGHYVLWGNNDVISKSMNSYAAPLPIGTHPLFADIQDSILVIDRGEKPVSSRAGHEKMNVHPFKKGRITQAGQNLRAIIQALRAGDWNLFSRVTENEALTLHSLMMSSDPGFLLMQPNTIMAIEKINTYRKQNNIRITYTLDAGPNLHVLYPVEEKEKVQAFIHEELAVFCDNNYVIHDRIGNGPVQIL